MKRSILTMLAVTALLFAAPVIAQDDMQNDLNAQNEALEETYDNRTQPDADSIAGDSALTITGTVHEWNDEQIALKTDTGVHHIQVLPNTTWDGDLTVGDTITVGYTRTTQGVMIAESILSETNMGTSTVTETTTTSLNTEDEMDMQADADMDMEADAEMDMNADADWNDDEMDADTEVAANLDTDSDWESTNDDEWSSNDELPATGSELPLLGLLGLLSLVAAIGVRTFR